MLVDMKAGMRCRSRELGILVHDLGGPGILAWRQIEERPIKNLGQTKNAVLAVELVGVAALDECRGLGG